MPINTTERTNNNELLQAMSNLPPPLQSLAKGVEPILRRDRVRRWRQVVHPQLLQSRKRYTRMGVNVIVFGILEKGDTMDSRPGTFRQAAGRSRPDRPISGRNRKTTPHGRISPGHGMRHNLTPCQSKSNKEGQRALGRLSDTRCLPCPLTQGSTRRSRYRLANVNRSQRTRHRVYKSGGLALVSLRSFVPPTSPPTLSGWFISTPSLALIPPCAVFEAEPTQPQRLVSIPHRLKLTGGLVMYTLHKVRGLLLTSHHRADS